MKTLNIRKMIVTAALMTSAVFFGLDASAQTRGGASGLLGKPLKTPQDIESLQSGDVVAMACPKCKTITFTTIEEGRNPAKVSKVVGKHQCPGCKSEFEIKGAGKGATEKLVHTCQKCGSDLAFCCAINKDEITKGMEK